MRQETRARLRHPKHAVRQTRVRQHRPFRRKLHDPTNCKKEHPTMSIAIEKLHAGYKLTISPHRSLVLTAQDLRDIYDWCLSHMRELEAASTSAHEYTLY